MVPFWRVICGRKCLKKTGGEETLDGTMTENHMGEDIYGGRGVLPLEDTIVIDQISD